MRRINRINLDAPIQTDLDERQTNVCAIMNENNFDVESVWNAARQSRTILSVLNMLQQMMGEHERCMYCLDSHGTDIEHYWPKKPYPEQMFRWSNLLLICAECNRFKKNQFPLSAEGLPLLIDPTSDEPWDHLDFDPQTGNMTAKYTGDNNYSPKGEKTVDVLHLDRRQALAKGYRKTFKRLSKVIQDYLDQESKCSGDKLAHALCNADDHGLLGWCFRGAGQNIDPFKSLRDLHSNIWNECRNMLTY